MSPSIHAEQHPTWQEEPACKGSLREFITYLAEEGKHCQPNYPLTRTNKVRTNKRGLQKMEKTIYSSTHDTQFNKSLVNSGWGLVSV